MCPQERRLRIRRGLFCMVRKRHVGCNPVCMPTLSFRVFRWWLVGACSAVGCAPQQVATPRLTAAPPTLGSSVLASLPARGERHVFRFDFVLSETDGHAVPATTSFTLNLEEGAKGEIVSGRNVAIAPTGPRPLPRISSPRQDVGARIGATFRTLGDDALLDVNMALNAVESSSSIRNFVSNGYALAPLGKPTLVTTLENDGTRYELTVVATKLR